MTELSLIQWLQNLLNSPQGKWFVYVCAKYVIFGMVMLAGFLGWRNGSRKAIFSAMKESFVSGVLAFGMTYVLGRFVARPRPFVEAPELIERWTSLPSTAFSFPSGHASFAYGLAFGFLFREKKCGLVLILMADLVAFGRVAAGVHYLTDVLAGCVVGLFAALIVQAVQKVRGKA